MTKSKAAKLAEAARGGIRIPRPERLAPSPAAPPTAYKMMGISLYAEDLEWVDSLIPLLKAAGLRRANRSFVLQQLIRENRALLTGTSNEEIITFFKKRLGQ